MPCVERRQTIELTFIFVLVQVHFNLVLKIPRWMCSVLSTLCLILESFMGMGQWENCGEHRDNGDKSCDIILAIGRSSTLKCEDGTVF